VDSSLNKNHKRHLRLTFEHVDNLLNEALQELNATEAPSPFQRLLPDSLPVQRKVLGDYIASLRGMMVRILDIKGIVIPKPQVSSLWSFQATLISARIAVEGIGPKYMRGYGNLSDETAHRLEALGTQLMDVLDRMRNYLARGAGQELQARLERLEKTTQEVESARVLEQVITTHGLVELRPSLEVVIERLESSRFETAVFGRVSSGKSSLLNYILRTDALPVGVTPVTAIPTRVEFGSRPQARIWFAEAEQIVTELQELTQYVTEQSNPGNTRHVTRIQVELPADRLKEGITFVDTPGLGSLARYGEMESLAYLPRCDLGIVLVDASSTLIQEDASIVNALRQAGAEVMVLLTKADVLGLEERTAVVQYARDQLLANLGFAVPVHLVSVKGPDTELCDHWFETALSPCLREHRKLAGMSLRRKVGLLREAAIAALQHRLDKRSAGDGDLAGQWAAVEPALNETRVKLEAAMREWLEWPGLAEKILDAAAREIVNQWRRDRPPRIDAASMLIYCGGKLVSHFADEVAGSLALLRERLIKALRSAAAAVDICREDAAEIPAATGMPILDLSAGLHETLLIRPRLLILLKGLAYRNIRSQLTRQLGAKLTNLLEQYERQLDQWRSGVLVQMRTSFTTEVDFYRAQCEQSHDDSDPAAIKNDLERLENFRDKGVPK